MVQTLQPQSESLYGLPQPIVNASKAPIVSVRSPSALDIGYSIGQVWINKTAGTVFILASNIAGAATWLSIGGTLTPAVASLVTGAAGVASTLAGNVWSATGTNAAITLTLTPKGTGGVTITSGDLTVSNGNILVSTVTKGLEIKAGAGGRLGSSTLVAGTKSIAIASVGANTKVYLSRSGLNASPVLGTLISDISVPGTLTVRSYDATGVAAVTDVSSFDYLLVEAL